MRLARTLLRGLYYLVCAVAGLAICGGLVIGSWRLAQPDRLQWYVTVRSDVAKGTKVLAENLRFNLRWLPINADRPSAPHFFTTPEQASGKYALEDIPSGDSLSEGNLATLAPADPPPGGAIVSIDVKTNYTASLKPGMRLSFAQQKAMVPGSSGASKRAVRGLLLVSLAPSSRDPGVSTLSVEVPKGMMHVALLLATGEWRPIVVDPATSDTIPSDVACARPAELDRSRVHALSRNYTSAPIRPSPASPHGADQSRLQPRQ